MTEPTKFEIGANLAGVVTLDSLGVVDPEWSFDDYSETVKLNSGLTRGLGFPRTSWHYGFLYKSQYDALRTYCTGVSAAVCIATMNNEMGIVRYNCNMEMPTRYAVRSPEGKQIYQDVTISFTELVEAE